MRRISQPMICAYMCRMRLTLLAPQSHIWGQSTQTISSLSPKRDWGPKRVKYVLLVLHVLLEPIYNHDTRHAVYPKSSISQLFFFKFYKYAHVPGMGYHTAAKAGWGPRGMWVGRKRVKNMRSCLAGLTGRTPSSMSSWCNWCVYSSQQQQQNLRISEEREREVIYYVSDI